MRHVGLLFALACGPKIPGATTPASSTDLDIVAADVLNHLPVWEGFDKFTKRPRIVVLPTENQTKFAFDTHVATAKLVNGLIRNSSDRFEVIDPDRWAAQQAAAAKAAKAGEVVPEPSLPSTSGDLLLLYSEVRATKTAAGDGRVAEHVLMTYRLVDSTSARALWAFSTEWTKAMGEEGFEMIGGDYISDASDAAPPPPPEPAPPEPAPEPGDAETGE